MTTQKQDSGMRQLSNEIIPHMPGYMDQYKYKMKAEATLQVTEVCYLLEVSWKMCHAWITHWTVARATLTMPRR